MHRIGQDGIGSDRMDPNPTITLTLGSDRIGQDDIGQDGP